ncbi:hypothetical protein [Adlercreutzia sp. ZJ138]|uniref:hypothetical protein n=1 Tax=Adlercreutzia sp. ZJ138 TaxID=2709405 RepID=UPI0013EE041E|nr:hypothetical protein [Adlercreutzia sp. ZJ138]
MEFDMLYFRVSKGYSVTSAATDNSKVVADLHNNNFLYDLMVSIGVLEGYDTEIAQLYKKDLRKIIQITEGILADLPPMPPTTNLTTRNNIRIRDVIRAAKNSRRLLEEAEWGVEEPCVCVWHHQPQPARERRDTPSKPDRRHRVHELTREQIEWLEG